MESPFKFYHVYVMGVKNNDSFQHHKIGISHCSMTRLSQLETEIGFELEVKFNVRFDGVDPEKDARDIEKVSHMVLADRRKKGEWFSVTKEEAIAGVKRAIALVDYAKTEPNRKIVYDPRLGGLSSIDHWLAMKLVNLRTTGNREYSLDDICMFYERIYHTLKNEFSSGKLEYVQRADDNDIASGLKWKMFENLLKIVRRYLDYNAENFTFTMKTSLDKSEYRIIFYDFYRRTWKNPDGTKLTQCFPLPTTMTNTIKFLKVEESA